MNGTTNDTLYIVMNSFSGRYLKEASNNNIGHETINFFKPKIKSKPNLWLLWLNSGGIYPKIYKNFNGNITLLMVTNDINEKNKYIILAKAEKCNIVDGATISGESDKEKNERFNKFLDFFDEVKYGKKTLQEIFKDNVYHGKIDGKNTLATFYTEEENIFVPEVNTKILIAENDSADIKQNMSNESMRLYVKDNKSFNELMNKIKWVGVDKKKNELPNFSTDCLKYINKETFLTISKKEKDELALSNIISYSLSNSKNLLKEFINYLSYIGIIINNKKLINYNVIRENNNVDITLLFEKTMIIIENKIDSDIVKYYDKVAFKNKISKHFKRNENLNDIDDMIDNLLKGSENKTYTQLTKYYITSQIENKINEPNNKRNIYYLLLVPKYTENYFNEIINSGNYLYANKYKIITYKDLYNIFEKVKNFPYRDDILNEFNLLSAEFNNTNLNREIYKFLKKANY